MAGAVRRSALADQELDALRSVIRGGVFEPTDPGFASVRAVFNAMHDRTPSVAVRCSGTADVIDAVRFARDKGMDLAVRGGGHSVAGLSTVEDGLLVDLSPMDGVEVDPDRRIARVQGGALWGDVDRETQAFGLATPGGVNSETGVGGLTLGGGEGWLRRKYGLSCDNLLEARIVCADGEVRTASAHENADLFWAIRGGGGNFGVATSLTFQLHPVGPTVAFAGVMYPVSDAPAVLRNFRDYAKDSPDDVSSLAVSITFPDVGPFPPEILGQACTVVAGVWAGLDVEQGMGAMQPLRELGTPLADISGPMTYRTVQSAFDELSPRGELRTYWKSQFLDDLPDEACDLIGSKAQERPRPLTVVSIFRMGGAINRVGSQETAFPERSAEWMVSIDGTWRDVADDVGTIAWVRSTWQDISDHFGNGRVYLNFTGHSDEGASGGVDAAFGTNFKRLAEVKARYDPDNFFHINHNIWPTR